MSTLCMLETYTPPNNASISFHALPVSVRNEQQTLIVFWSVLKDHTSAKFFFYPDPTFQSIFREVLTDSNEL